MPILLNIMNGVNSGREIWNTWEHHKNQELLIKVLQSPTRKQYRQQPKDPKTLEGEMYYYNSLRGIVEIIGNNLFDVETLLLYVNTLVEDWKDHSFPITLSGWFPPHDNDTLTSSEDIKKIIKNTFMNKYMEPQNCIQSPYHRGLYGSDAKFSEIVTKW
jgi:hypothetical protein